MMVPSDMRADGSSASAKDHLVSCCVVGERGEEDKLFVAGTVRSLAWRVGQSSWQAMIKVRTAEGRSAKGHDRSEEGSVSSTIAALCQFLLRIAIPSVQSSFSKADCAVSKRRHVLHALC